MKRRTSALVATLSLLPLGQPLLLGTFGITTATTAVVLHAPTAVAQDASSVAKIAKATTVRIEGATQGSGVIVKKQGDIYTVLTAWHVVNNHRSNEELVIRTSDNIENQHIKNSIRNIRGIDMATLHFTSKQNHKVASIRNNANINTDDSLLVAGFPVNLSGSYKAFKGEVVASSEMGIDGGYQLLYSANTYPGMSGGGIYDSNSMLIGIHGRGEQKKDLISGEVFHFKTGINQGVPVKHYINHAKGNPPLAPKTAPEDPIDYFVEAFNSLYKKGGEQTSIRLLNFISEDRKAKISNRELALIHLIKGIAFAHSKYYKEANDTLTKSLKLVPASHVALSYRGYSRMNMGLIEQAMNDLTNAIELNSENHNAYQWRAYLLVNIQKYAKAIDDLTAAINLQPSYFGSYINRGIALGRLGMFRSMCKDIMSAAEMDSTYAIAVLTKLRSDPQIANHCIIK